MTLFRSSGSSSLSTSSGGAGVFESGIGTTGADLPKSRGTGTGDGGSGSWDSTGICATGGCRINPRRPPNKTATASKVTPAVSACAASVCRVEVLSELMDSAPVLLYPALATDAVVPALKYSTSRKNDNQPVLLAWRGRRNQDRPPFSNSPESSSSGIGRVGVACCKEDPVNDQPFGRGGVVEVAVGGDQRDGVGASRLMEAVDFKSHGELHSIVGAKRVLNPQSHGVV